MRRGWGRWVVSAIWVLLLLLLLLLLEEAPVRWRAEKDCFVLLAHVAAHSILFGCTFLVSFVAIVARLAVVPFLHVMSK